MNKHVKELDLILKQKDLDLESMNKVVKEQEKMLDKFSDKTESLLLYANEELTAKNLENISTNLNNFEGTLETISSKLESNEREIKNLKEKIKTKEMDLINTQNELDNIKKSWSFRSSHRVTKGIDDIFPNGTKRGNLKQITLASLDFIRNYGLGNYFNAVKTKMERKEFSVIEPIIFSQKDEDKMITDVIKNRKNRVLLKPHSKNELDSDQIDILDEEFSL